MEVLLTISDLSIMLRLSKSTIYTYTSKNTIPHIKLGTKVLFDRKDIEKWVNDNKSNRTTK